MVPIPTKSLKPQLPSGKALNPPPPPPSLKRPKEILFSDFVIRLTLTEIKVIDFVRVANNYMEMWRSEREREREFTLERTLSTRARGLSQNLHR